MTHFIATDMNPPIVQRYGRLVALLYLGSALFFVALGVVEWQRAADHVNTLAQERGASCSAWSKWRASGMQDMAGCMCR